MKLSKKITELIKTDLILRLELAKALRVSEYAIIRAAHRNSKSLLNINSISVIKAETGLTEAEIFETENVNA